MTQLDKWGPRFRGAKQIPVWVIGVLEGSGTEDSVARVVNYYVSGDDGRVLFQEDPCHTGETAHDLLSRAAVMVTAFGHLSPTTPGDKTRARALRKEIDAFMGASPAVLGEGDA